MDGSEQDPAPERAWGQEVDELLELVCLVGDVPWAGLELVADGGSWRTGPDDAVDRAGADVLDATGEVQGRLTAYDVAAASGAPLAPRRQAALELLARRVQRELALRAAVGHRVELAAAARMAQGAVARQDEVTEVVARRVEEQLRGRVDVLRRALGYLSDPTTPVGRREEALELGRRATTDMGRVLDDVETLVLSTPPASHQTVELEALLAQVVRDLAPLLARTDARVLCHRPARLRGDERQLEALLRHLVRNAAEHAHVDQVVVEVDAEQRGDQVVVCVSDNGTGPTEQMRRALTQGPAPADDGSGGGIGLSVVRAVAEGHAGRIWLERDDTGGTRVCCELPGAPVDADPSPEPDDPPTAHPTDGTVPRQDRDRDVSLPDNVRDLFGRRG